MIKLENVSRAYKNGFSSTYVLRQISFEVNQGEFVSIMGPSGAGKSTLLHIVGLLDTMTEGKYYFLDNPIHELNDKKRTAVFNENMGFIFQSYHLIDELTVYENLDTPLLYKKVKSAKRKSMVCDMLDRFQIVGKKDLFPHQLSGGQQQLVGVARALISEPKLLLADEPTGNLHSAQGEEIMGIFKNLNKEGTTIIQVTHSEKNAAYGSRIINLQDGWLEDSDSAGA